MYSAIVLAAGIGSRMGLGYNKMLYSIKGYPVIIHTLRQFLKDSNCGQLLLVVNEREVETMRNLLKDADIKDTRIEITIGGSERQYSVYNGLQRVVNEVVLVHDGARPFVTKEMIDSCCQWALKNQPAIVAVPVKDTIKRVVDSCVIETIKREEVYSVQTPQAAPTALLKQAHQLAQADNFLGTDEASLIEKYTDATVRVVEGAYTNIKLTTQEDLLLATQLLDSEE